MKREIAIRCRWSRPELAIALVFGLLCGAGFSVVPASAAPLTAAAIKTLKSMRATVQEHIAELEQELTPSSALDKYRKEYMQAIPHIPFSPAPEAEIQRAVADAPFIFLGDEHTTAASQDNAVAVMAWAAAGKKPLTLVLEWIDESFQTSIDTYLSGKTTLTDLRKAIQYDKLWGFPWKGYARVLEQAKRLKLRVLLAERLKTKRSLRERDLYITKKIATDRKAAPHMRYLVIYGDYHVLGNNHLSHLMGEAGCKPQVILFGEAEPLYWSTLDQLRDPTRIRFLSAGHGLFYIRNGTPLERAINYRNYLMKLLGFRRDDFEEWVDLPDLAPFSGAAAPAAETRRFDALHAPPAQR